MAKNSKLLTVLLIIVGCFGIGYGAGMLISALRMPKDGEQKIIICATSDIHGAYFDSLYISGEANKTSMANVSQYLKDLRVAGEKPVVIDNGDNLQGNNAAYYFNYVATKEKHVFSKIVDYMGYDAVVLGNHDIEAGHEVYDRIAREIRRPYLAANAALDLDENGVADMDEGKSKTKTASDSYFLPYCVIRRDGIRIAVIGMTNGNIKNWLSSSQWHGIDFQIASDIAQELVDEVIEKEKPHLVVISIHSGKGSDNTDRENEAYYLATHVKGVDLVISGHDHKPVAQVCENEDGKQVLLMNPGWSCIAVAQAEFLLDIKDDKVVSSSVSSRIIPMTEVPVDPDYVAYFKEDYNKVRDFACRPVGELADDIYFADALEGPSTFINLLQKVQLSASGADISFAAPLTSRGFVKKGTVAFQDLATIYRFENQLYVVKLTGAQVKDYLEMSYDNWVNGVQPSYNWDSADGIIYTVSKSAPKGSRVNIVSMSDGSAFDPGKSYDVAMTSYRASGGGYLLRDGAGVDPKEVEIVEQYKDIRSLIYEYMQREQVITPTVSDNWSFVD